MHKSPANEVVLGMDRFFTNVPYDRRLVLIPRARTLCGFSRQRQLGLGRADDELGPEWKYVNVRRLFIFLEHPIDKCTQWAVFEPNNERLWASIKQTVEEFLRTGWRSGALMGTRPKRPTSSAWTAPR